jgi:hypothetical protein
MANLFDTLNSSNFDFYFLVVDEFLDINIPKLSHFISLSPQRLGITLAEKNSGRLLAHPVTQEFIKNNSAKTGREPAIIPFKPSAKIDLICRQNNWKLISNPSSLNRLLEDKIKFSHLCLKYQLPVVPFLILPFTADNYQLAQQKFGSSLVLQTHFGWAGNSSFLSSGWDDVSQKISPEILVKFSPYLQGYSLINNCCLTNRGLIQSPPGLQYTGLKPLTQNPLATVGRQWPSFSSRLIQAQIKQITVGFSRLLHDLHYLGFFGLDFLITDNQVYLLECNPRLTASFAFYTQIEINAGLTPLFLYHLAEFCRLSFDDLELSRFENNKIIGSEITLKNSSGATIKKYHDFTAFSPATSPVSIDPAILARVL